MAISDVSSSTLSPLPEIEISVGSLTPQPTVSSAVSILHPVFINSDLDPSCPFTHTCEHDYPIDRLHPACMGYYNHSEYETAMASIRAIEDLYRRSITEAIITPPISENTLQHRRSQSIATFVILV